jgi:uncharacterized protein (UPF0264 family)
MTKWLASVQSLDEAQALELYLPDILDMKNPAQGALGALNLATVQSIVSWVNARCLTSATVGDLPMRADVISAALVEMAATGVDYVKIGLFAEPELDKCISELEMTVKMLNIPVIAVIFADQMPKKPIMALLKQSGFAGVMVDTADKNGQSLLDHWSSMQLKQFVTTAQQHSLLCGLAGALKIEDIELLKAFGADYLGFRSALCNQRCRTARLQPALAEAIQQKLQEKISLAS